MFHSSDTLVRKFLTATNIDGTSSGSSGLQDPTFLGFTIKFSYYNDEARDGMGRVDANSMMPGLLLEDKDIDSAYGYLRRVGRPEEAEYIKKFREQLQDLENNKPWYFQSITGMEDVVKSLEPGNFWRGKDKVLTIECLESIDMQMSFLASLYRKATFEEEWKRVLLPSDKRKFIMTIIVAEIRNINLIQKEVNALVKTASSGDSTTTSTATPGKLILKM